MRDTSVGTTEIEDFFPKILSLKEEVSRVLVGQNKLFEAMLLALLSDGHLLVEGVPGLAKTTAIRALADAIAARFSRIQFTPDLLPADLIGTQIFSQRTESFSVKHGPINANIILADEINRAPAKVQSGLLEAMQERQVTIGEETFLLPQPFLVLATQNPIDQEGTYPLPEAQVDRFMLKINLDYPSHDEEVSVMKRTFQNIKINPVWTLDDLAHGRSLVERIYFDEKLYHYVVKIVAATRNPDEVGLPDLKPYIQFGASPRASISIYKAAKAHALLQNRAYVTPQDIKSVCPHVLGHRIILSYQADLEGVSAKKILTQILSSVPVP